MHMSEIESRDIPNMTVTSRHILFRNTAADNAQTRNCNAMKQNYYWESDSCLVTQENPRLLQKPKAQYCNHNNSPLDYIENQLIQ